MWKAWTSRSPLMNSRPRRSVLTPSRSKSNKCDSSPKSKLVYSVCLTILVGILLCVGQITFRGGNRQKNRITRNMKHPFKLVASKSTSKWGFSKISKKKERKATTVTGIETFSPTEYRSKKERDDRVLRFPSVEERVKLYMSDWYVPPCLDDEHGHIAFNFQLHGEKYGDGSQGHKLYVREVASEMIRRPRTFELTGQVEKDASRLFYLHQEALEQCSYEACSDVLQYIHPWVEKSCTEEGFPTILDLGDKSVPSVYEVFKAREVEFPVVPHLKKYRLAYTKQEIDEITAPHCIPPLRSPPASSGIPYLQPVLWKLKVSRHYGMLKNVTLFDIPYAQKQDKAVFRGRLSGIHKDGLAAMQAMAQADDLTKCLGISRCRLVLHNAKSQVVDARLVGPTKGMPRSLKADPGTGETHECELFAEERMSIAEMLQYKAIIVMEGNDVSASLKWALYSNSVVLMESVTVTSWAMEERLRPWVHYVPMDPNGTDVEERLEWVLDNPIAAERIAHQGSLWIMDLLFHPDAAKDEELIYEEMIRRYQAHFVHNPLLL